MDQQIPAALHVAVYYFHTHTHPDLALEGFQADGMFAEDQVAAGLGEVAAERSPVGCAALVMAVAVDVTVVHIDFVRIVFGLEEVTSGLLGAHSSGYASGWGVVMLDLTAARNLGKTLSGLEALTLVEKTLCLGCTDFGRTAVGLGAESMAEPCPLLGRFQGYSWTEAVV